MSFWQSIATADIFVAVPGKKSKKKDKRDKHTVGLQAKVGR